MSNFYSNSKNVQEIETILSSDRLETYLSLSNFNHTQALVLYRSNILKSHRFYTILHILEVCLRNKIDICLSKKFGTRWFDGTAILLTSVQNHSIVELKNFEKRGQVIASLSFGFWTAFFGKTFEELWRKELRTIFSTSEALKRGYIADKLKNIRILRNRIAHHECILKMELNSLEESAIQLIQWLSPVAYEWLVFDLL